jgi:hypothetical protein
MHLWRLTLRAHSSDVSVEKAACLAWTCTQALLRNADADWVEIHVQRTAAEPNDKTLVLLVLGVD